MPSFFLQKNGTFPVIEKVPFGAFYGKKTHFDFLLNRMYSTPLMAMSMG